MLQPTHVQLYNKKDKELGSIGEVRKMVKFPGGLRLLEERMRSACRKTRKEVRTRDVLRVFRGQESLYCYNAP